MDEFLLIVAITNAVVLVGVLLWHFGWWLGEKIDDYLRPERFK